MARRHVLHSQGLVSFAFSGSGVNTKPSVACGVSAGGQVHVMVEDETGTVGVYDLLARHLVFHPVMIERPALWYGGL
jgi:hypothetical protein